MAIPPLSKEERRMMSNRIIVGTVVSVSHDEVTVDQGTNHVYIAQVNPINEEDADDDLEDTLTVTYWQAGDRKEGWTGDTGQYAGLPLNEKIRLYLGRQSKDGWRLIEPNGWERVE